MASAISIELARRGQANYEKRLRAKLEAAHPDEFVALEAESGDYYLGQTLNEAIGAARAAHSDRLPFALRIGHRNAVHIGVLTR